MIIFLSWWACFWAERLGVVDIVLVVGCPSIFGIEGG
jgi:hypothetical protein